MLFITNVLHKYFVSQHRFGFFFLHLLYTQFQKKLKLKICEKTTQFSTKITL
jgi:hypothetical protein